MKIQINHFFLVCLLANVSPTLSGDNNSNTNGQKAFFTIIGLLAVASLGGVCYSVYNWYTQSPQSLTKNSHQETSTQTNNPHTIGQDFLEKELKEKQNSQEQDITSSINSYSSMEEKFTGIQEKNQPINKKVQEKIEERQKQTKITPEKMNSKNNEQKKSEKVSSYVQLAQQAFVNLIQREEAARKKFGNHEPYEDY